MASNIGLRNNINTEFLLEHSDNKPAGFMSSHDISRTVDTVADMEALIPAGATASAYDKLVCVVREEGRGGTFIYDSTKVADDNQGTNFKGWIRQYSGAVNVKWFGAVGDGITDDTASIQKAIDSNNIIISSGTYKIMSTVSVDGKSIKLENATLDYYGNDVCLLVGNCKSKKVEFESSSISLANAGNDAIGFEVRGMWNSQIISPTVSGKGGNQIGINITCTYLNGSGNYGFFTTTVSVPNVKGCRIGIQLLGISASQMITHCTIINGWLNNAYRNILGQYIADSSIINIACDNYNSVLHHMEFDTITNTSILRGEYGTVLSGGAYIKAKGNCVGTWVTGDRTSVDNSEATAVINRHTGNALELQASNAAGYRAIMSTQYAYGNPFNLDVTRGNNTSITRLLGWNGDNLDIYKGAMNITFASTSILKIKSSTNGNYSGGISARYSNNNQLAIWVSNCNDGSTRDAITFGNSNTKLLDADIQIPSLPTTDPAVVGQLWNNSGVVTVSAG